jgi:hypothetical protein
MKKEDVVRLREGVKTISVSTYNVMASMEMTFQVAREVAAQEAKWGLQTHPDGCGPDSHPLAGLRGLVTWDAPASQLADVTRQQCDASDEMNSTTWWGILFEEIMEALAEDPDVANEDLDKEITQVAAVCVSWLKDRARRRASAGEVPA